jgi:hypothetical protein
MKGTHPRLTLYAFLAFGLALLSACGTVGRITGGGTGASTETEARNVAPEDPLARPIQVGWTSARASHCGFIFDADQLRASFLASEARTGLPPEKLKKVEEAYDYTRKSVLETIASKQGYCNKERTAAIRRDLTRYLAGDFSPGARMAR